MSISSDKGRDFERECAKLIRQKLKLSLYRDNKSGAGTSRQDIKDWYQDIPYLSIECKNQRTIKIGEWFRQSIAASSIGQMPTVVFNTDDEILASLRFDDLLNLIREIQDQRKEIELLREPTKVIDKADLREVSVMPDGLFDVGYTVKESHLECRGSHLADQWGYCQQLDCKYSRGYRPKKIKKA